MNLLLPSGILLYSKIGALYISFQWCAHFSFLSIHLISIQVDPSALENRWYLLWCIKNELALMWNSRLMSSAQSVNFFICNQIFWEKWFTTNIVRLVIIVWIFNSLAIYWITLSCIPFESTFGIGFNLLKRQTHVVVGF